MCGTPSRPAWRCIRCSRPFRMAFCPIRYRIIKYRRMLFHSIVYVLLDQYGSRLWRVYIYTSCWVGVAFASLDDDVTILMEPNFDQGTIRTFDVFDLLIASSDWCVLFHRFAQRARLSILRSANWGMFHLLSRRTTSLIHLIEVVFKHYSIGTWQAIKILSPCSCRIGLMCLLCLGNFCWTFFPNHMGQSRLGTGYENIDAGHIVSLYWRRTVINVGSEHRPGY
jgi:hypothetical protein